MTHSLLTNTRSLFTALWLDRETEKLAHGATPRTVRYCLSPVAGPFPSQRRLLRTSQEGDSEILSGTQNSILV